MSKKRVQAYYAGKVHSVGFRSTAKLAAKQLGLVGFAKNCDDGRVEVVCEGEEGVISEFLKEIEDGVLKKYITNIDLTWSEARGGLCGFDG